MLQGCLAGQGGPGVELLDETPDAVGGDVGGVVTLPNNTRRQFLAMFNQHLGGDPKVILNLWEALPNSRPPSTSALYKWQQGINVIPGERLGSLNS